MPNGYGGVDPGGGLETRKTVGTTSATSGGSLFKGVADSLAEARTREEGKYLGSRLFFAVCQFWWRWSASFSARAMEKEGGRPSAVEGRKRPDGGLEPHVEGGVM